MDRAYWIIWYDLPPENDAYLDWLHRSYIPKVVQRPGVLWAAHYASVPNVAPLGGGKGRVSHHASSAEVPSGGRYILIFGASAAHAFANPGAREFDSQLPDGDRKMLAMRTGERTNIIVEEARIDGPEAKRPDPELTPGPWIQLGSFNSISYQDEDEMATWYAQWRLRSLKALPGVIRVRKLVSVSGWAKHACFYEFTSLEARAEHFVHYESTHPEMEAWSKKIVSRLVHATPLPSVAQRIWPPA